MFAYSKIAVLAEKVRDKSKTTLPNSSLETLVKQRLDIFTSILFSILQKHRKILKSSETNLINGKALSTLYNSLLTLINETQYLISFKTFNIEELKVGEVEKELCTCPVKIVKDLFEVEDFDKFFEDDKQLHLIPILGLPVIIYYHCTQTTTKYRWCIKTPLVNNGNFVYRVINDILEVSNLELFQVIREFLEKELNNKIKKSSSIDKKDLHMALVGSLFVNSKIKYKDSCNEKINEVIDMIHNTNFNIKLWLQTCFLLTQSKTSKKSMIKGIKLKHDYIFNTKEEVFDENKHNQLGWFYNDDRGLVLTHPNIKKKTINSLKCTYSGNGLINFNGILASLKTIKYNNIQEGSVNTINDFIRPGFDLIDKKEIDRNDLALQIKDNFLCSKDVVLCDLMKNTPRFFNIISRIKSMSLPWDILYNYIMKDNKDKTIQTPLDVANCIRDLYNENKEIGELIIQTLTNIPLCQIYNDIMYNNNKETFQSIAKRIYIEKCIIFDVVTRCAIDFNNSDNDFLYILQLIFYLI